MGKGWSQIKVLPPRGPPEPNARSLCAQEFVIPPAPVQAVPHYIQTPALAAPISPPEPEEVQGSKGARSCWRFSSKKHLPSYGWLLHTGNKPHFHAWGWQGRALAQVMSKMHGFMVSSTPATLIGLRANWEFLGKAGFYRKILMYQESIFNKSIQFHAIFSSG